MKYLVSIILILLATAVFAGNNTFPKITADNLAGVEIETSKFYNGDALWGLINGGADLYLEYGFSKLLFQEIKYDSANFRIEIYEMKDSLSAFGIYSISKFKCGQINSEYDLVCVTKYQTQGAKGNYYISISNSLGNENVKSICHKIFEILIDQIIASPINKENLFSSVNFIYEFNDVKIIRGPLAVQNGFPNWSKLLENQSSFLLSLYSTNTKSGYIYIGQLDIQNEGFDINKLKEKVSEEKKMSLKTISDNRFILVDSDMSSSEIKKYLRWHE